MDKGAIIFYFTGTGNSLYVAKRIKERFKSAKLESIADAMRNDNFNYDDYDVVGFVTPLYFMGMPKVVKEFINKISISKASYIFTIITRAYTKGMILIDIKSILKAKDKELNYGEYITFPDCYIRWDQAHSEKSQEKIFYNAEIKIGQIKKQIKNKENYIVKEGSILNIVALIVYNTWKSTLRAKGKTFKVSNECTKCGICIKSCPMQNIIFKNEELKWESNCQDCMACVQNCPNKAIYFDCLTKKKRRYKNPNIKRTELEYK